MRIPAFADRLPPRRVRRDAAVCKSQQLSVRVAAAGLRGDWGTFICMVHLPAAVVWLFGHLIALCA
eukprot:scaffold183726_cov24-Tisochrysis_lutea.AAC.1